MTIMAETDAPAHTQPSTHTTHATPDGDETTDTHSDTDTDGDTDPLTARLRDGTHNPPFPGTAQKPCRHCATGVVWHDNTTGQLMCDDCYRAPAPARPHITPQSVTGYPREADCYQRETYAHSNRVRLIGGYTHAYDESNGSDYALDGNTNDTLLAVPNARTWHRSGRADD